jgi:hypothetical protein
VVRGWRTCSFEFEGGDGELEGGATELGLGERDRRSTSMFAKSLMS